MAKALKDVIAELPGEEREQVETRAQQLVAEEMSLQDLRRAIGKTQVAMAKRLKVGQDAVSKLETRSDMYLSTLRGFVKAMGGELELIARFPDRPPVRLNKLAPVGSRKKRKVA
ncbi:MAG: XRE family transcriptional regulator [Proteobacteria bacterium]|nr:XRE family transcriptional regulator [Pseudomonadota bacterium]